MTIALGILCTDGIVIAADTQHTSGNFKIFENKIRAWETSMPETSNRPSSIAVTGADCSDFLKDIQERLLMAYGGNPQESLTAMHSRLDAVFKSFHENVVMKSSELYNVSLIIGAERMHQRYLWSTLGGSFKRNHSEFLATGTGAPYADSIMRQMYPSKTNTFNATLLATYVLMKVNDLIDGCSSPSTVVRLKGGINRWLLETDTDEIQREFRRFEKIESGCVQYVTGSGDEAAMPLISRNMKGCRKSLEKILLSKQFD